MHPVAKYASNHLIQIITTLSLLLSSLNAIFSRSRNFLIFAASNESFLIKEYTRQSFSVCGCWCVCCYYRCHHRMQRFLNLNLFFNFRRSWKCSRIKTAQRLHATLTLIFSACWNFWTEWMRLNCSFSSWKEVCGTFFFRFNCILKREQNCLYDFFPVGYPEHDMLIFVYFWKLYPTAENFFRFWDASEMCHLQWTNIECVFVYLYLKFLFLVWLPFAILSSGCI